ncbi:MAG: diacylglycerol kinase [Gammaproteobacteria bacterium]|jgi:diacylglycerol kinase (ATP)|nr:diacylglycerol kinase [Gammaproteobacteria bacterium]
MPKPHYTGLQRVIKATEYSVRGLRSAWRHEIAFRQECMLTVLLVPCAFLLGETLTQTALLIGVCLVVLCMELLNSAVEAAVDRIGEEVDDLAGRAKDMGSAAVAIAIALVWITWGLVALQRLL